MNEQLTEIVVDALEVIIGILIGFFFGEPIKRFGQRLLNKREEVWDRKARVAMETQQRPRFRVTQLCDPKSLFDFSSVLKEQNRIQEIVLFEVDDFRRSPGLDKISELKNLRSKKDFLDRVGAMLAQMRGEMWRGVSDRLPNRHFEGRRDLIITNIPIPGNFYGWNSKDRNFLLISTAPIAQFFSVEGGLTIEDFIVRLAQRMAVFSLAPSLDPMTVHADTSAGCLFDFNILLRGVVDVVKKPDICPTCAASIAKDQGDEFYERLSAWIKSAPSEG